MSQINSIYTTVSGGQLHIAADTKYIGSVNSYNNCFTRFFAWVFDRSMTVNFDGKMRSVNKESYTHLICSLTQNHKISSIAQYSIFRSVAETATLPASNLKMRDVIIGQDRQALYRKLAAAISQQNTARALLMIGKGAEVDAPYYEREGLSPSFGQDAWDLGAKRYNFTVFCAAPILQAARKNNEAVCKFLQEAGANLAVNGNQYTFKRKIISVEKRQELVMEPRLVPHHYHTRDANGLEYRNVRYHTEVRPRVQERTIVNTRDARLDGKVYLLNEADFRLVEA